MPTTLTFEEHGAGVGDAWTALRDNAVHAGFDAPVPSCPGWAVRDLVAHQGMVHRWATGVVLGGPRRDPAPAERAGRDSGDLLGWFDEGVTDLLGALACAPDDLQAFFFLEDAPPPKRAWARRQCHETTMHAVDAMSAVLGRPPEAAQTWIRPAQAVDGIDELLGGFLPRGDEAVRSAQPRTVLVEARDTGHSWTLQIGTGPVVTTAHPPVGRAGQASTDADVTVLTGTATQLFLGLWNRGEEIRSEGPAFLPGWRRDMTVSWD